MGARRRGRRRSYSRRFSREDILRTVGIVVAVLAVVVLMAGVVLQDNKSDCVDINGVSLASDLHGCRASSEKSYKEIYVVYGNTANSPKPEFNERTGLDILYNSYLANYRKGSSLRMFFYSVTPDSVRERRIFKYDGEEENIPIESYVEFSNEVNEIISRAPEEDNAAYLSTLTRAIQDAQRVHSSDGKKPLIIVLGSGLSDAGFLNFADRNVDLLHKGEIKKIAESTIANNKGLEVEEAVEIKWFGCGIVARNSAQAKLGSNEIARVRELYEEVLLRMNEDNVVEIFSEDTTGEAIKTDFKVMPVRVDGDKDKFEWAGKSFDEHSELGFEAGKTVFMKPDEADMRLNEVARDLKNNNEYKVVITGYIAAFPCPSDGNASLAGERAKRVREELINKGVPAEQIEVQNGGILDEGICSEPDEAKREEMRPAKRRIELNIKKRTEE